DPAHVAEPQPDPAPAAEEDDDAVQEGAVGKKDEKLKGPSWTECMFGAADPVEFPGGPNDTSVLTS
ncbi:hypothetical protein A2U01_0106824, partial [Trifolium medium]|nr:hypothetical protein [Trifolium medium]